MYDPKDYIKKKKQVKRQEKAIICMVVALLLVSVLYACERRASKQYQSRYDEVNVCYSNILIQNDSLQKTIDRMEADAWFAHHLRND